MKLGYSLPKIQQYFSDLYKNKEKESIDKSPVPIGGDLKWLEVYEVPLDLPRYRLSNTRTIAMQEQYIASNDLEEDYFEQDVWSDKLQEIQHEILSKLIHRKNLKAYFQKKGNIQTDPLILTNEGFVISGNRRLCTFRELYYNEEGGQSKYKHFQRVRVVILPKMTEEEIEYVEDYFEQEEDIQDDFTWTNRALGFEKRLKKHGYSVQVLAEKTNVKKGEIEDLLSKLSVAREYLDFINKPKAYNEVDDDEYAFKVLLKTRRKFNNNPAQKDIFQKLSFVALSKSGEISDRMYKNIPFIKEEITNIQDEMATEFSDQVESFHEEKRKADPLYDEDDEDNKSFGILSLVDKSENQEGIFEIVLDKVTEHKTLKAEKKRKNAVIDKIKKARTELEGAYSIADGEKRKEGIGEQLDHIDKVILKIRGWLNND